MFPPVALLVPHRGAALLLDDVIAHDRDGTRCRATLGLRHPYMRGETVDCVIALELMAQTIAVHAALAAPRDEPAETAPVGYVLGSPALEFHGGDFRLHDCLHVVASPIHQSGSLAKYRAEVYVGDELRAAGELSVYVTSSEPSP